ncbi:MAG: diaminopimelate decarboxylase [Candidatus Hydrothermae bacterium]|nr:diaminopimelate decarboxylase [Candidatus Hydrothermae bacterium]
MDPNTACDPGSLTPALRYHRGILHLRDHPLPDLARRFGTPLYVYDLGTLRQRWNHRREAFYALHPTFYFAVKANDRLGVLSFLAHLGAGAEGVSRGEVARALQAGIPPERIQFGGLGKTPEDVAWALQRGIRRFSVESLEEEALFRNGGTPEHPIHLLLRLLPELEELSTHRNLSVGARGSPFGMTLEEARSFLRAVQGRPGVQVVGLHVHLGSQLTRVDDFRTGLAFALEAARTLGPSLRELDLGGGFPVRYPGTTAPPLEDIARVFREALADQPYALSLEPGRWLVAEAGILLVRVLYRKIRADRTFVVVDGGMSQLLRPALYGATHGLVPVQLRPGPSQPLTVVGPSCERSDVLRTCWEAPLPEPGDLLAVLQAGAYGSVMSNRYNAHPLPAEVAIDEKGQMYLLRRRERLEETWAQERMQGGWPWM